jgi:galactokinase
VHAEKSGAVRERYNAIRWAKSGPVADHVRTEAARVLQAVEAIERNQPERFGQLLLDSHASLRDRLQVSVPALDRLVDAARGAGALGARLTGAGFGGCAVIFCLRRDLAAVRAGIPSVEIIDAEPSEGAVHS